MKKLSMTNAWNETAAFVKREFGLLFLIAFGLVALPTVILQAVAPDAPPGQTPEPGAWMLLVLPVIALSIIGSLTMTGLALGRSTDARDAFGRAIRRFPIVFFAVLLVGLAAVLLAMPLAVIVVLALGTGPAALALLTAAVIVAFLFIWVRMMMLNPVGVAEEVGPAGILKRSWRLTAGHFWRLFGFVIILILVFVVLSLAVTAVLGSLIILLAGQPQEGNLSAVLILLLNGLLSAVLGVFLTSMVARIYVQLAAEPTSGI
jgi:hypothetical protein